MSQNLAAHAAEAYAYPLLLKQLLHGPKRFALEQEIVYGENVRLTYRELFQRIGKMANLLKHLEIEVGQTVAVMDWDSHRYLENFFAVPMYGAILQTVNVRLSADQIAYTLNHAGARVLLVHQEFLPLLAQFRDQLKSVEKFILIEESDSPLQMPASAHFIGEYEQLLQQHSSDYDFPDFDENTRATTFYTTGTTGDPKGVYFSHRQLVLHTLSGVAALGLSPTQGRLHSADVYMPITPMFHVHAWGVPYMATMAGIKQVYPGRYVPDVLLKLKEKEAVTFSHCVPTILMMLLHAPKASEMDFSGWKMIIGGSVLPAHLAEMAMAKGIDVYTGYGMSETCPILTLAHLPADFSGSDSDAVEIRTKSGRPIPLVDIQTVDEHMQPQSADGRTAGEVVVRSPWLTQGYLHNQAASDRLWQYGWLHTQDIGCIDAQGYLKVTDRIKDVIKTGGEWVSSLALENIIGKCPGVIEVAVIGVADEQWGERPIALIVKTENSDLDEQMVKAHVMLSVDQGHISKYAVPDRVRFVDALERTSVGKINKRALRSNFAS